MIYGIGRARLALAASTVCRPSSLSNPNLYPITPLTQTGCCCRRSGCEVKHFLCLWMVAILRIVMLRHLPSPPPFIVESYKVRHLSLSFYLPLPPSQFNRPTLVYTVHGIHCYITVMKVQTPSGSPLDHKAQKCKIPLRFSLTASLEENFVKCMRRDVLCCQFSPQSV